MTQRIFIAINLPEEIKQEIFKLQKKWPTLPCRWVKQENLHLTLAFLGNISEKELLKVIEIVKRTSKSIGAFEISLDKTCYGPDKKIIPPRLVWVEGKEVKELSILKQDLDKFLSKEINFRPEDRKFKPHITLGRIKKWNWRRIPLEERPDIDLGVSLEFPVRSIDVMESRLKKTGAIYEKLASFPLVIS